MHIGWKIAIGLVLLIALSQAWGTVSACNSGDGDACIQIEQLHIESGQ